MAIITALGQLHTGKQPRARAKMKERQSFFVTKYLVSGSTGHIGGVKLSKNRSITSTYSGACVGICQTSSISLMRKTVN